VKPDIMRVLEVCATTLMVDVAANVTPSYRQASVFANALLLTNIREELDRIAERRVDENRALRALFAQAAPDVADAALRARLVEAAEAQEGSLLISALDASNEALRQLAIELHAYVETQDAPAARCIEASLWRELKASTERRKLGLNAF
jgi:hypothetical protein